ARRDGLLTGGEIIVTDKGFAGQEFEAIVASLDAQLIRPDRKDEPKRFGKLGGVRQWIESVNQTLKGQLNLEAHGGRTPAGVFTRIAQRLLAMAAGIWHNWTTGVTSKRSLTAYDH
ncbi:MAG: IS982 family transposase, partial [Pseudonocardiaceae bacterium]